MIIIRHLYHCGGTCDVWPAGGLWAGWEHTGSAGGIGPDCGHLLAIRPIRECVLMCLRCVVVGEPGVAPPPHSRDGRSDGRGEGAGGAGGLATSSGSAL
jgi:hypothetical protein